MVVVVVEERCDERADDGECSSPDRKRDLNEWSGDVVRERFDRLLLLVERRVGGEAGAALVLRDDAIGRYGGAFVDDVLVGPRGRCWFAVLGDQRLISWIVLSNEIAGQRVDQMPVDARDLLYLRHFGHLLRLFLLSHDFRAVRRGLLFDGRGHFNCIGLRRLAIVAVRRVRVGVDKTFTLWIVRHCFAGHGIKK